MPIKSMTRIKSTTSLIFQTTNIYFFCQAEFLCLSDSKRTDGYNYQETTGSCRFSDSIKK